MNVDLLRYVKRSVLLILFGEWPMAPCFRKGTNGLVGYDEHPGISKENLPRFIHENIVLE